ncbi:hypothetical protein QYE76_028388 [Lolium multiflorum]|uniref:Transposase (putative) gypsy type domain-containing protein n=1 Tax=Lolium multiflorum TaxID=4521 RepID=A0AAD8VH98_LOLMU|nr:hypothetical protein QYE76_028388 [Lolium multiflorum]
MPGEHRGGYLPLSSSSRLLRSFSSFELFTAPARFLHRFPGELRRAAAPTFLRRAAAATPPIRRHGAARVNGKLVSTALSPGEERFFLAVSPLLVFFFLLLVNGPAKRFLEGFVHARGRHRASCAPPPDSRGGLGLPASHFFRRFLDFFGLPPHHLPANACILLSCYVAFMEGYAGLWPDVEFWSRLFYIKAQTTEGHLRTCGAASIYSRTGTPFPRIPTVDSVKNWQMSFFYVRNDNPVFDRLNLPEYNPAPPGRLNWGHNARTTDPDAEVNLLWDFLGASVSEGRLSTEDLLCTYTERRVMPLQMRVHKIGHMSAGLIQPDSKLKAQVARRVNSVTKANMPENWDWGLMPHDRASPPELLFDRQGTEDGDLAEKVWTPDHVDPADQAGDQAGDDDLPEVPDQGGQGEHNPPPSPSMSRQEGGGVGWRLSAGSPRCANAPAAKEGINPAVFFRARRLSSSCRPRLRRLPWASSSAVPPSAAPGRGGESVRRPTLDELFPRRAPLLGLRPGPARVHRSDRSWSGELRPGAGAAGARWPRPAGCAARGNASGRGGPHRTNARRAASEPSRRSRPGSRQGGASAPKDAGSGVGEKEGRRTHRRPPCGQGARLLHVPSASDSSLGSAGTMEKAWHQADACEVAERRTVLYNQVVTSYHKAKIERAGLARELEVAKAEAARVPQLESNLRAARAQCAESEEAGAAAKLKVADGELARLRRLEDNHLKELAALKKDGEEKLEGPSKRLEEVDRRGSQRWRRVLLPPSYKFAFLLCGFDVLLLCGLPEAQDAALAAVGRRGRSARWREQSSACFTMEDYLASMAARVEPITKLGWELRKAAEELIRLLWPTETLPQDLANLISGRRRRLTASLTGRSRLRVPSRYGPLLRAPGSLVSGDLDSAIRDLFDQVDSILTSFFGFSFCV